MSEKDEYYMNLALSLAAKGTGFTSPNPLVGCVIVKNNRVISSAFHKKAGSLHAERLAIMKAGKNAKGADLYVNLEPCAHYGKTPPCTDIIISAGIKRVIIAMKDPNPLVKGKGIRKLQTVNCKLKTGILKEKAEELNKIFIKNMKEKMPYVLVKAGMSLDGKIALKNGKSKWITSPASRKHAQGLRKQMDAVLVGINTVLKDNPSLSCRAGGQKRIKKVILDTKGRVPLRADIFRNTPAEDVYIFTRSMSGKKIKALRKKGVNIILSKAGEKNINEKFALNALFEKGIMSVLVEGGSCAATSFIKKKLADEMNLYIAPKIIGGGGLGFFGKMGYTNIKKVLSLKNTEVSGISGDILVEGKIKYS